MADRVLTPTDRDRPGGEDLDDPYAGWTPSVHLEDLHVTYRIRQEGRPHLRDVFRRGFHAHERQIHAVRGITMTAYEGQIIGVVGRNGQGKSTLLQAIAGLLPPTSGHVYAATQPTLLGVKAALQARLSGRRNILLGGLALGLDRDRVEDMVDEVLEFAGLEQYGDVPIRAYSSGMRARLFFSLATSVRHRILLIDEMLSVGDEDFRERSRQRLEDLRDDAGTVFLVSHNLGSIRQLCNRAIWIESGRVLADGSARHVSQKYLDFVRGRTSHSAGASDGGLG